MLYDVILPAAGSGKRMGAGKNKLFLPLNGAPILMHTLFAFEQDEWCKGIHLAVKKEERAFIEQLCQTYNITKVQTFAIGGDERQHSVYACVQQITDGEIVLVHDAARPFIRLEIIHRLVEQAACQQAAVAGVLAKDTMKRVRDGVIEETVDRSNLWMIQTPQAFQFNILKEAEQRAAAEQFLGTDEAMLVERMGIQVYIVESDYENIKMTTKEDLIFGEAILRQRTGGLTCLE